MSLSRGHKHEPAPKVEINIVPLVDVALVLLIIFMVTATFVKTSGMRLDLPSSSATQAVETQKRALVIGITPQGQFLWDGAPVSDAQLSAALRAEATAYGTRNQVTVQGDTHAEHGRVVEAMTRAQAAGFTQLVIATKRAIGGDDARR